MKYIVNIILLILVSYSLNAQAVSDGEKPSSTSDRSRIQLSQQARKSETPNKILMTDVNRLVKYWEIDTFNKKVTKYFIDSLIKNYNDTATFGLDCRDSLWRIGNTLYHRSYNCSIQNTIIPTAIDTHIIDFKIVNDTIFHITRSDGVIFKDTLNISKLLPINGARLHLGGSAADTANIIGQIFPHDLFYWSVDTCKIHVLFRQSFNGVQTWMDWGELAIRGDCMPYLTHDVVGNGVSPIKVPNSNTLPGNKQWLSYTAAGGCLTVQAVNTNNEIEWKLDTNCIKGLIDTVNHLQEFNTTGTLGGQGIGKYKTTLSLNGGDLEVQMGEGLYLNQITAGKNAVVELKAIPLPYNDSLVSTISTSSQHTFVHKPNSSTSVTTRAGVGVYFDQNVLGENGGFRINVDTTINALKAQTFNGNGVAGGSGIGSFTLSLSNGGGTSTVNMGSGMTLTPLSSGLNSSYLLSSTSTVNTLAPIIGDGSVSNPITLDACSAWFNHLPLANPSDNGTFLFINQFGCLTRKACTCSVGMIQDIPSDNIVLVSNTGQPTTKDILYKMALKIEELERRIIELELKK